MRFFLNYEFILIGGNVYESSCSFRILRFKWEWKH